MNPEIAGLVAATCEAYKWQLDVDVSTWTARMHCVLARVFDVQDGALVAIACTFAAKGISDANDPGFDGWSRVTRLLLSDYWWRPPLASFARKALLSIAREADEKENDFLQEA